MHKLTPNTASCEANALIESIEALGIHGNIVPMSWCAHIQFESGKPDFLSMMLLAELVYWHRPEVVARDEKTGKILRWKKRFKGEKLHRSRSSLAKKFCVSQRQITDALTRLEASGFIEREVCHQTNRLYLTPIVAKLSAITVRLERKYVHNREVMHSPTPEKNEEKGTENTAACDSAESHAPLQSSERPRVTDYPPLNKNKEISEENTAESKQAAALPPLQNASSFIGETLTPCQQQAVEAKMASLELPASSLATLRDEVLAGLLDETCFSKTGRHFHQKLNTILKSIHNGTWTRPFSLEAKHHAAKAREEKQQHDETQTLKLSWSSLWNELGDVHRWMQTSSDALKGLHKARHQACLEKLSHTEKKLFELNATFDFTHIKQKNKERLYVQ